MLRVRVFRLVSRSKECVRNLNNPLVGRTLCRSIKNECRNLSELVRIKGSRFRIKKKVFIEIILIFVVFKVTAIKIKKQFVKIESSRIVQEGRNSY